MNQSFKKLTTSLVTGLFLVAPIAHAQETTSSYQFEKSRPVSQEDHIRGAKNPKITLIEYSDTECPFCKNFHKTLTKTLKAYPDDVQWVYRHFPLTEIHSRSKKEAEATECAYDQGGDKAFWKYLDYIYRITPSNNKLNPSKLNLIAKNIKLDQKKFKECLSNGKTTAKVQKDRDEAQAIELTGTPATVVILPDGARDIIAGFVEADALIEAIKKELGK